MNNPKDNLKNIVPCLMHSCFCGILTGLIVFAFKWAASAVTASSEFLYRLARENTVNSLLLLCGVALLACISYLIITKLPACCGLDVTAAVRYILGRVSFNRVLNIFVLFFSALVTFFSGVPLGSEGPSIQMGCAVGYGSAQHLIRKNPERVKYMITGGACAGFCAATGAIFSGVFFAVEEVYRRFSPLILLTTFTAAVSSAAAVEAACYLTGRERLLFHLSMEEVLPLRYLWVAVVAGLFIGVFAVGFVYLRRFVWRMMQGVLGKIPKLVKMICIFVIVGLLGIVSEKFVGSGHHLIDELLEGHRFPWQILLLYLSVRLILVLFSTQMGITGGLFIPFLAFGAMAGGLLSEWLISLSVLPPEYRSIMVLIGMLAFLAAVSKIPLTAIVFSVEAVCGLTNALPIAVGVGLAYGVIALWNKYCVQKSVQSQKSESET